MAQHSRAAADDRPESRLGGWIRKREVWLVAGLVALGVGLRAWIAFTNYGVRYDTDTAYIVSRLLQTHPLAAYTSGRYPYPGGYLPVLLLCRWIADAGHAAFWAIWKVPSILGDAGISIALAWGLRRLGVAAARRLLTVALVALGPVFVVVSGFHGQLDPVAILPALLAVILWTQGGSQRAWQAGLLVGLGAAVKTVPLFMALAMLPTVRSRREAAALMAPAVAVPLISVLPFLLAHPHATFHSLTFNNGVPGLGGLSVVVQPSLLHGWLYGRLPRISSATWFFVHRQNLIVGAGVLLAAGYAWRRRMEAIPAAGLIWVTVYLTNFNWAFQYWIWGLPFFLLAGRLAECAWLQALIALPAAELYFHFAVGTLGGLVLPITLLTWCLLLLALVIVVRRRAPAGTRRLTVSYERWPSS